MHLSFQIMPPDYAVKKTRSRLSNAQRKEICEYAKARPAARHQDIADEFMRKNPTLKLDRSTITKTLQKSEQYLYLEESPVIQNQCKNKLPKYPLLETAMTIWVNQASSAGMVLSDELVKLKGREFGNHLGIPENELKFSNGWVSNFKKRNSLRRY